VESFFVYENPENALVFLPLSRFLGVSKPQTKDDAELYQVLFCLSTYKYLLINKLTTMSLTNSSGILGAAYPSQTQVEADMTAVLKYLRKSSSRNATHQLLQQLLFHHQDDSIWNKAYSGVFLWNVKRGETATAPLVEFLVDVYMKSELEEAAAAAALDKETTNGNGNSFFCCCWNPMSSKKKKPADGQDDLQKKDEECSHGDDDFSVEEEGLSVIVEE